MIRLFFGIDSSANTPHPCTLDLRRSIFGGSGSGATLYRTRPPEPFALAFVFVFVVFVFVIVVWAARALTWIVASRALTRYQERISHYSRVKARGSDAVPPRSAC